MEDVPFGGAFGGLDVSDLRQRVDAGIGAAGASSRGVLAKKLTRRAQEHSLDRAVGVLLRLPAAVPSAVVLEGQFPGRHPKTLSEGGRRRTKTKRNDRDGSGNGQISACPLPSPV